VLPELTCGWNVVWTGTAEDGSGSSFSRSSASFAARGRFDSSLTPATKVSYSPTLPKSRLPRITSAWAIALLVR
jgi:hypothetical protein